MLDSFYSFMDRIFRPLLPYPASLILIFSIAITLVITLIYLKVVDQEKVLRIREELDKLRKELNSLRKEGIKDKKKNVMKMQKKMQKMNELQFEMMKENFKPTLIYIVPLFLFFYWLRHNYSLSWIPMEEGISLGGMANPLFDLIGQRKVVMLPFKIPSFLPLIGGREWLGYLGWYLLCFWAFSSFWRKLFGIR